MKCNKEEAGCLNGNCLLPVGSVLYSLAAESSTSCWRGKDSSTREWVSESRKLSISEEDNWAAEPSNWEIDEQLRSVKTTVEVEMKSYSSAVNSTLKLPKWNRTLLPSLRVVPQLWRQKKFQAVVQKVAEEKESEEQQHHYLRAERRARWESPNWSGNSFSSNRRETCCSGLMSGWS